MALTILWAGEYGLRIWSCVEDDQRPSNDDCTTRRMHVRQPMMLLDLLSLLSLVVDLSIDSNQYRGISSMRLLTVFRLEREFNLFVPVLRVVQRKGELLLATVGIAGVVLLVGSVMMFYIESEHNPAFSSVLKAMWWCSAALTTVGYGDIYPTSGGGRFLAAIVAFLGLGIFGMPAGIIASGFQEMWEENRELKRSRERAHHDLSRRPSAPRVPDPAALQRLEEQQAAMAERLAALQDDVSVMRGELAALCEEMRAGFRALQHK